MSQSNTATPTARFTVKALSVLAVKIFATALSFVLSVILARALGPEQYGLYAYIIAVIGLLSIPASLGLPNLVTRLVASFAAENQWGLLIGAVKASFIACWCMSVLVGVLALLFFTAFDRSIFPDQDNTLFVIALILIPVVSTIAINSAALRGMHHVVMSQISEYIARHLLLIIALITSLFVFSNELTARDVIYTEVITASIAMCIGLAFLYTQVPRETKHTKAEYRIKSWAHSVWPLLISAGTFFINSRADIIMLGILSNAESVGIYQVAARGGFVMLMPASVIAGVIAPMIARLYTKKSTSELQRLLTIAAFASFAMTLPMALVLIAFGDTLLGFVFGKDFVSAYLPLAILTLGQLFSAAMGASALALNMCGFERYPALGVTVAAGVNIALNWLLIPSFGIIGAALATTGSLIVWNCLLVRFTLAKIALNPTTFSLKLVSYLRAFRPSSLR